MKIINRELLNKYKKKQKNHILSKHIDNWLFKTEKAWIFPKRNKSCYKGTRTEAK